MVAVLCGSLPRGGAVVSVDWWFRGYGVFTQRGKVLPVLLVIQTVEEDYGISKEITVSVFVY